MNESMISREYFNNFDPSFADALNEKSKNLNTKVKEGYRYYELCSEMSEI
jgi:hypothetical protein